MEAYSITKTTPVLIYSGGYEGKGYAKRLAAAGFNVVGILDIKPENVINSPVPVFYPEEIVFKRFPNAFVWICLGDSVQHMKISRLLNGFGCEKLLMLPLYLDGKRSKEMTFAFNAFCLGHFTIDIPYYGDLWNINAADYVLDKNAELITVMVHKNHLYGLKPTIVQDTKKSNPFSLLKVTEDNPLTDDDFDSLYLLEDSYKSIFMDKRNDLYQFFESALYSDLGFFVRSAGFAQYRASGKFWYVLDGYHRCSYLLLKGFRAIPLRVKLDEWECYFNASKAQALMDYCKTVDSVPVEIEHPAFMRFPVDPLKTDAVFMRKYSELFA